MLKRLVHEAVKRGKAWTVGGQLRGAVDLITFVPGLAQQIEAQYPEWRYKYAVMRYFLDRELCYVEVPKVRKMAGIEVQSMDKFLATASIGVVAKWLGVEKEDAERGYGKRLEPAENEEEGISYVKLTTKSGGVPHVVRPRKDLNIAQRGLRIIPVSLLEVASDTLTAMLEEGVYTLEYIKNSGEKREQVTTLNRETLLDIYKNEGFVDRVLEQCVGLEVERGYMTLPEVGASLYDEGVRRVTLSRLTKITQGGTVETGYLHVDLKNVPEEFIQHLWSNSKLQGEVVCSELEAFGFKVPKDRTLQSLEGWVKANVRAKGTPFMRELHDWMVMHQSWFSGYTGRRVYKKVDDSSGLL